MESHIGLKQAFSKRSTAIVGNLGEYGSGVADILTGRDNEAWSLDELHILPLRVARDGLVQPLRCDCRAVGMACGHQRELEEGGRPSVQNLNVYRVDFLELLDQDVMVAGVEHLREGEDEITPKGDTNISRLKCRKRPPKLLDARLFCGGWEADDHLRSFRPLSNA